MSGGDRWRAATATVGRWPLAVATVGWPLTAGGSGNGRSVGLRRSAVATVGLRRAAAVGPPASGGGRPLASGGGGGGGGQRRSMAVSKRRIKAKKKFTYFLNLFP